MSIQDDKKRERIYTHHKTVLNKKELIKKLPGWNLNKFDRVLDSLKQKEVIDVNDMEANHKSRLTEDESELLTLLSMQSIAC